MATCARYRVCVRLRVDERPRMIVAARPIDATALVDEVGVMSSATEVRSAVCIVVKAPVPGRVKTRLAAALGDGAAVALARAFLVDTCTLAGALENANVFLAVDGALAAVPVDAPVWRQPSGDLGRRLERILRRALSGHTCAIALGADSPGLPIAHLRAIVALLAERDAVLGPAADGGFYALGVRRVARGMLANVRWSTEHALADAAAQLKATGFDVAVGPDWFDVDTERDLIRFERMVREQSVRAEATARLLGQMGRITWRADTERRASAARRRS